MVNYNMESFILGIATSCLITAICLGKVSLIIWEALLTAVIIGCIVIKYNRNKKTKTRRRRCNKCTNVCVEARKSVYGDYFCEDCWDEYVNTDEGVVENLLTIAHEDLPVFYFGPDFLGHCVEQWKKNKSKFIINSEEIDFVESKLKQFRLL